MHFIKSILLGISSLLLAFDATSGVSERSLLDSVFQHMTPKARLSQLVLTEATPGSLDTSKILGGVYYSGPLSESIPKNAWLNVYQLDDQFNPFPLELADLPSLNTLSAIRQKDILLSYLKYFESACRTRGIDVCVLPNNIEKYAIAETLDDYESGFFIRTENLGTLEKPKKKSLTELFQDKKYWLIAPESASLASKKLDKYAEKILEEQTLYEKIHASIAARLYTVDETSPTHLSKKLTVAIRKGSIIPLQSTANTFPLRADTICFLTDHPFGSMAAMLEKYAYVLTSYDDIRFSNYPIIVDNDANIPQGLLASRQTIFIGELEQMTSRNQLWSGALAYTSYHESYSYIIPQQLFGSTDITGQLPYSSASFKQFTNSPVTGYHTLGYAPPEMAGIDDEVKKKINAIMREAIVSGCTPGAQLTVAVDGALVLDEAYGHLTYDSLLPTDRATLYDLASVTKVSGTLLAIMKLYEEHKIDLDIPISNYLPEYTHSNKAKITLRALLAHNAGLKPYVPFWQKILTADMLESFYYANEEDEKADRRSYGIRPNTTLVDTLTNWIIQSPLVSYDSIPPYLYSDIGFMILHQVVEKVSGQPMDQYLSQNFYSPMGLTRLTFNPLNNGFQRFEIAPTERDYYFRNELIWGEVHDRNAAVFGGIAGHAGLFANAHDLTIILQTVLQGGHYNGKQLLSPATIQYFNQQFFPNNRRALGWDKKDDSVGNVSFMSSGQAFGHTGFTGTIVWADPDFDLVFVFLSNRIHPNANNLKLIQKNIRTRLQDVVYEALLAKWIK